MNVCKTSLPGVFIIEPRVFEDDRGWFMETYHAERLADAGVEVPFVQDNHSLSRRGVLRGLHYQIKHPQGKLVRVVRGEIYDVAVDLRRKSPTFGNWLGVRLGTDDRRQMYIPPGFAHGFLALSDIAEVVYKCTDVYHPEHERTLIWNDSDVGIAWPLDRVPLISEKDNRGARLTEAEYFDNEPNSPLRPTPPHFPRVNIPGSHSLVR
jgi:dTDP-4-dehydrorhamnose 3,5-epimerase